MHKTVRIIKDFRPDIVIGTGGYACWPMMAAAARMGIPTALHESNAMPGLAVRRLQEKVDMVWINFEDTKKRLSSDASVIKVGNPLRHGFGTLSYAEAREKLGIDPKTKFVLSFGGSLGAEDVNTAVLEMMRSYSAVESDVLHVHAAGKRDFENTRCRFEEMGLHKSGSCVLTDYIYDMPLQMAAADLVISRAGAMTLSELALMKKACILIPSPYVTDDHQYLNAKALADQGAAILVEERTLSDGVLTDAAKRILSSVSARQKMQESIAAFADENANKQIWNLILQLTKR